MTYYPNRFKAQVLKVSGFEAWDTYVDEWGSRRPGELLTTDTPSVRVGWDQYTPRERRPRSHMERWLGSLGGRGTNIELDPSSLEIRTAVFVGAYWRNAEKYSEMGWIGARDRQVFDLEGTGTVPELNDREVHVKLHHTVLHQPTDHEKANSLFLNTAFIAPLPKQ